MNRPCIRLAFLDFFRAAGLLNIKLQPASYAYSMKKLSTFRITGSVNVFGVPVHVEILTNPNKGVRIFAIGFSFDGESFGALSKRLSGHEISFLDVLGIDLQVGLDKIALDIKLIIYEPGSVPIMEKVMKL